ncbi:MAG: ATP-binding protein [Bacilli bacterium]|jgi:predicted AAA+ superfamily ATPase|nr:ATP-binding protein [Bacilli bacterium]
MKYINRFIERKIEVANDSFKVVMLTGARQVGKSTVLKHLAQKENINRNYVTLDDPNALYLAINDPELFFQQYPLPLIIGEIQYAPEIFSYIKFLIDKNDNNGQIWITGSQNYNMLRNVQESLAGRIAILNLHSLSLREILNLNLPKYNNWLLLDLNSINYHMLSINDIFNYIYIGGMPAALSFNDEQRYLYYDAYINSYLMRDVLEIGKVTKSLEFKLFLQSLAALTSQELNYASLANVVGVSQNTIKEWVKLLEGLGIIYLLKPYYSNELKRLVKTPKVYFYDTGLCAYLSKWLTKETLQFGAANGAYFENFVIMQLIKNYEYSQLNVNWSYYRYTQKREIDLVLENGNELYLFEIKMNANPDYSIVNRFKIIEKENTHGGIICMKNEVLPINNKYNFIPASIL